MWRWCCHRSHPCPGNCCNRGNGAAPEQGQVGSARNKSLLPLFLWTETPKGEDGLGQGELSSATKVKMGISSHLRRVYCLRCYRDKIKYAAERAEGRWMEREVRRGIQRQRGREGLSCLERIPGETSGGKKKKHIPKLPVSAQQAKPLLQTFWGMSGNGNCVEMCSSGFCPREADSHPPPRSCLQAQGPGPPSPPSCQGCLASKGPGG